MEAWQREQLAHIREVADKVVAMLQEIANDESASERERKQAQRALKKWQNWRNNRVTLQGERTHDSNTH